MKNLVFASIIAVASAMSAGIPAEAAIPVAPVQAPAASSTVLDAAYYYRGPNRTYYRGPARTYYRGPNGAYAGGRCYMKRVTHYRNGRAVVDHVRVCR